MHEGAISVHSEGEGHGSTFRLEIPMTRYVNHTSILVLKNDQTVSPKQCTDYDDHEEIKGNDDQLTNNNNNLVNSIHNSDNIPSKMKRNFCLLMMLRKLLEIRGHVCEEAENGLVGVYMVKAIMSCHSAEHTDGKELKLRNYDAIFMDYMCLK